MKKLFALVLCVLLVAAVAVTAFAAGENKVTVTVDKTEVKPGDTINVTVSVAATEACSSFGFVCSTTSEYYEYVSGAISSSVTGTMLSDLGPSGLVLAFGAPTTLNGEVCTMQFKVKAEAPVGSFNLISAVSMKNGTAVVETALNCPAIKVACDHEFGAWTDNGNNHIQTCGKCGEAKTENHKWDAGEVTTEPDCKNDGVKTFTCSVCSATKTEAVPSTGNHSYGNGVKVDENQHKVTCAGCGDEKTVNHTMDNGTVTTKPTCSAEGVMTYACTGCAHTTTEKIDATGEHVYGEWIKDDAENHKQVCEGCGKSVTEAHAWDEGELTKEPTCNAEGTWTYTCSVCGETKDEVIAPDETLHVSENWTLVDEDTHKGLCSVCNQDVVVEHQYEAYFTEDEHWGVCPCGAETVKEAHELEWVYSDEEHAELCWCGYHTEIAAHTWDEGVVTVKPTTQTTGIKTHTCPTCGATKETEIPKIVNGATGDNNMNVAFVVLAVLSACGLAVTVIGKKRSAR